MVGREIQPDTDRRTESGDRLELKRTDFHRQDIEIASFARDFRERFADVAAGDRALAARVQHLREQLGRCRLAIRAGDRDHRHSQDRQPSSSSPMISIFREEKFRASADAGSIPGLSTTIS